MDLALLTNKRLDDINDEALQSLRDRSSYNATLIENRNVITEKDYRIARRLRRLHFAVERELDSRLSVRGTTS